MSTADVVERSSLAGRLRQARKKAGLTQRELADRLGLTRTAPCQWETGASEPTTKNLRAAAQVLGVSVDWLSTGQVSETDSRVANESAVPVTDGASVDLSGLDASLAATLKAAMAGRKSREVWRLTSDVLAAAGFHRGEFLIVDTAQQAKARDIVMAQLGPTPIFRLYFPPYLLTVKIGQQDAQLTVDNVRLSIRGVVVSRYSV